MTNKTNNRRVDSALGLSRARRPQLATKSAANVAKRRNNLDSALAVPVKIDNFEVKLFMDNIPVYVRTNTAKTLAAD